jgi:hypothetical protein
MSNILTENLGILQSDEKIRNLFVVSLSTNCNNAVILWSCYKVVTHNLLTNCWIARRKQVVATTCNKTVEFNNLVASRQQAVDNLSTSWEQAVRTHRVGTALLQVCCRFVTTCAFLRVYFIQELVTSTQKNMLQYVSIRLKRGDILGFLEMIGSFAQVQKMCETWTEPRQTMPLDLKKIYEILTITASEMKLIKRRNGIT